MNPSTTPNSSTDPRSFAHSITNIAIAHLCERSGFQGFHQSAIETLSDIALKYILLLGRKANFHSNLARRTHSTLPDVIQAIQDVNTFHSFSDFPHLKSSSISDIALYIHHSEQHSSLLSLIPSFPLPTSTHFQKCPPSQPRPTTTHIPPWLPPFPDPKLYQTPPSSHSHENVPRSDETIFREEKSAVSLECEWNSFEKAEDGDEVEGKKSGREMGFSLGEIFSPVVEGVGRMPDDLGRRLLLEERRNVRLRIGIGRSMSVNEAGMRSRIEGGGSLHVKEVEKDERRKRAEKILKECVDNPNELLQM